MDALNPTEYTGGEVHPVSIQIVCMHGALSRMFDLADLIRVRTALGLCRTSLASGSFDGWDHCSGFGLCYMLTSVMSQEAGVQSHTEGYQIVREWAERFTTHHAYPFMEHDGPDSEYPLHTEYGRKPRLALLELLIAAADSAIHAQVRGERDE